MVILRWKYLVLGGCCGNPGRLRGKSWKCMFSSLSALDNGAAGQNVRLVIEKLGIMRHASAGPSPDLGYTPSPASQPPYCSTAGKPQVSNLSVCDVFAVLSVTSTVDMREPFTGRNLCLFISLSTKPAVWLASGNGWGIGNE